MPLITAARAPVFEFDGVEFTGYAAPSRGSGELCAWRISVEAGHASDQAHTLDADEVFLVTSGTITLSPSGPRLRAGDCMIVPAGAAHPARQPRRRGRHGARADQGRLQRRHVRRHTGRHAAVGALSSAAKPASKRRLASAS